MFVANRVQQIKDTLKPQKWGYIWTNENPADHVSRGRCAKDLQESIWFTEPAFLWSSTLSDEEPIERPILPNDPEVEHVPINAAETDAVNPVLTRLEHLSD